MKYAYNDNSFGWLKRVIVDKNGWDLCLICEV